MIHSTLKFPAMTLPTRQTTKLGSRTETRSRSLTRSRSCPPRNVGMSLRPFRPGSSPLSALFHAGHRQPERSAQSLLESPPSIEPTCRSKQACSVAKRALRTTSPGPAKVKLAFHSSVLVAAVVETHQLHGQLRPWLEAVKSDDVEAHISWRAAAETWLVLTHRRGHSLADADAVIERLLEDFQPVETTATIYREALRRCTDKGLGYALVDALHLVAAEETGADGFVTLHGAHFEPLCTPQSPKILPPEPPSSRL